ncbi:MAG: hypothetical protein ACKV2Q_24775 [Planctomycetaceae bacterium]
MHYTGGFEVVNIERAGRNAVAVTIRHDYTADVRFQLYQNRTKIGCTSARNETRIIGAIPAGASAAPLGIIVVDPAHAGEDFSAALDLRPWNEYQVAMVPPSDPPEDLHHFDLVACTEADGEIDETNIVARLPFVAGRPNYNHTLPTFPSSGEWAVAFIPRDDAQPIGNAGEPINGSVAALIYPLDFVPITTSAGSRRFSYAIAAGVLSIGSEFSAVPGFP